MSRYNQPIADSRVDEIVSIEGVNTVGMGLHEGREAVVVGVDHESYLDPVADQLPGEIEGYPVVVEVERSPGFASAGTPALGADTPDPANAAEGHGGVHRPVPPGVSVGNERGSTGTASFLATDGETIYQLSNNHVLADFDQTNEGARIIQPGMVDGGTMDDEVGELAGYVPVQGTDAKVDISWWEPDQNTELSEEILDVGEPQVGIQDPELGDEITFSGRSTGVATGTVDRAHMVVNLSSGQTFTDQFRIDTPLIPGDSGSPVVMETDDGVVPAGVGFAANNTHGYCNYISNVAEESGMTILPPETMLAGVNPVTALVVLGIGFGAYRYSQQR